MVVRYYDRDVLCSVITVDWNNKTVSVVNYTDTLIKRAFGVNENPTVEDFEEFLEERCFPRTKQCLKWHLKQIELTEYNPLEIVKKTNGRMYGDEQWLEVEDDE